MIVERSRRPGMTACFIAPVLEGPGRPASLSLPRRMPRDGAPRGAQSVHLAVHGPSLRSEKACAPRRSIAVSSRRRAALLAADPFPNRGKRVARTISKLLAAGPSAGGRSPGAARALKVRFLEPAGTASFPTDKTPHDSAPGRIGRGKSILC